MLQNSFPKLYELHTILLNHNNITDISKSVFTPLFSVRLVYKKNSTYKLFRNKICPTDEFKKLKSIKMVKETEFILI